MSRLAEVKEAIARMTSDEFDEFARWMNEQRVKAEEAASDAWDKQIEDDAKAGRLDHLIVQARADIEAGRVRPLPQ